jgi:hypothetical protein
MKEMKLLDRVQADTLVCIKRILATIQEFYLKSELPFHNFLHNSRQYEFLNVESVIDRSLSCESCILP